MKDQEPNQNSCAARLSERRRRRRRRGRHRQPAGGRAGATAAAAAPAAHTGRPGYSFLNLEEAAFVEALVDHMVPADELSPKGTDIGINVYIDRALAGAWGKGDRLYMQGPWKIGVPSQGYQLPLTPAQLYRAGIAATNAHCRKTYGNAPSTGSTEAQREEVLVGLSSGKITFDSGLPARAFWTTRLSDRDGRHVLRPDLWRQPQQGGLEADRLPRRHRGASRECRELSRQGIPRTIPLGIADMS